MPNSTRVLVVANLGDAPAAGLVLRARSATPGGAFRYAALDLPAHAVQTLTWEDAA